MRYPRVITLTLVLIFTMLGSSDILAQDKKNIEAYFKKAYKYAEKEKYEKAIKYYDKVIELDSNHFSSWLNIGACYYHNKQLISAFKATHKAYLIRPRDTSALYNLGSIAGDMGKTNEAIYYYKEALNNGKYPSYITQFSLGTLYLESGDFDSAKVYLFKAYKIDSTDMDVITNLAWIHQESNPEIAFRMFEKVYYKDSTNAVNVNNYGLAHLLVGKYNDAFPYFIEARKLDPENSFVVRNIGMYYMFKKDKVNARKYYKEAMDMGFIVQWGASYIAELKAFCNE